MDFVTIIVLDPIYAELIFLCWVSASFCFLGFYSNWAYVIDLGLALFTSFSHFIKALILILLIKYFSNKLHQK